MPTVISVEHLTKSYRLGQFDILSRSDALLDAADILAALVYAQHLVAGDRVTKLDSRTPKC